MTTVFAESRKDAEKLETDAKDAFRKHWDDLVAAQKREQATQAFMLLDMDKDQKLTIADLHGRLEFDNDLDGQVSVDEVKEALAGMESSDLDHFIDKVWHEFRLHYRSPDGDDKVEDKPQTEEVSKVPPACGTMWA
jgi:hypothetical protein